MKYTYSLLSNALALSVLENGNPNTWNYGENFVYDEGHDRSSEISYIVNTYFKPYLKVSEDLSEKSQNKYPYSIVLNNGITLTFETDGGTDANGIFTPRTLYIVASNNKNTTNHYNSSRDYSKHDMFFVIKGWAADRLYPFCWGKDSSTDFSSVKNREEIINHKSYGCNKTITKDKRFNCGALIMFDGWEIKDDYPW